MPVFELEADGKVYEIEAPDEATAIQAFSTAMAPQTAPAAQPQEAAPYNPLERFAQSAQSTFSGATQGATMGAYDEVASLLGTPIKGIENMLTGKDSIQGMGDILPFLGRSLVSARNGQNALNEQAFNQAPAAYIAGDLAGSFGTGLGMAGRGSTTFGEIARPTIAGMLGRGAVEGGVTGAGAGYAAAPEDTMESRLKSAGLGGVAGALLGGATGGVLGSLGGKAQAAAIPSVAQLKKDAGVIYDAGNGLSSPPAATQSVAQNIFGIAQRENVILPNGKLNEAYKPLSGILDTIDAYATSGQPVSVGQIQKIRDTIRDVVASPEPGVQRIALDMLDEFNDNYAYKVYPDLAEADDLYWRAKTGELIEKMGELSEARSGQYSQSGMENALRAEFRALERQIIKGKVKGLPPELVDQITKVAQGDEIQNFTRWLSKFGPQNPVTFLPAILAGMTTGSALPTIGILGAAKGAGMVAQALAKEKYRGASALARSGGNLPAWKYGPGSGAMVQGGANSVAQALAGVGG